MRQYTFSAISPQGTSHQIRCTAPSAEYARAQIVYAYSNWAVCESYCDIDKPHQVLGEIDASGMTADDYAYLVNNISA